MPPHHPPAVCEHSSAEACCEQQWPGLSESRTTDLLSAIRRFRVGAACCERPWRSTAELRRYWGCGVHPRVAATLQHRLGIAPRQRRSYGACTTPRAAAQRPSKAAVIRRVTSDMTDQDCRDTAVTRRDLSQRGVELSEASPFVVKVLTKVPSGTVVSISVPCSRCCEAMLAPKAAPLRFSRISYLFTASCCLSPGIA